MKKKEDKKKDIDSLRQDLGQMVHRLAVGTGAITQVRKMVELGADDELVEAEDREQHYGIDAGAHADRLPEHGGVALPAQDDGGRARHGGQQRGIHERDEEHGQDERPSAGDDGHRREDHGVDLVLVDLQLQIGDTAGA